MSLLLSTAVFLVVFVTSASSKCPAGAVQGLNAADCFVFGKVPSAWLQAEEECSAFDGHLTSIYSYLTNAFVVTMAVPCLGDYWLGGSKGFDYDDLWTWNDGQGFIFDNWAAGQPNVSSLPGCLSMDSNTGKWRSSACDAKKAYVCRVPAMTRTGTERPQPVTRRAPTTEYWCRPGPGRICP